MHCSTLISLALFRLVQAQDDSAPLGAILYGQGTYEYEIPRDSCTDLESDHPPLVDLEVAMSVTCDLFVYNNCGQKITTIESGVTAVNEIMFNSTLCTAAEEENTNQRV